ncbi:MAG: hypothetical protein ACLUNQ_00480 [Oscillospiraceae bacterium]
MLATTYWMDVTDLEHMRSTLEETKPVAAIVMIDNYEDLMGACPEGSARRYGRPLRRKWTSGGAPPGRC